MCARWSVRWICKNALGIFETNSPNSFRTTRLWLHAAVALGLWGESCHPYVAIKMLLLILTSPESSRKGVLLGERGRHTARCEKNPFMEKESLVQAAIEFSAVCGGTTKALGAAREARWKVGGLQMDHQFSYVLCSYLIFNFMISQVIFCSRSTKNLAFILILQHFGTESTSVFFFLLFHFLSWAIFKHHKFSLCVPIIRDRHDLHLHHLSSHFLSPTTKFLISYCSLQHFYALGTSKITVFFDFFTCSRSEFLHHELSFDFPIIIVHTWSSFSWRLKDRKEKKSKKTTRKRCPLRVLNSIDFH